MALTTLFGTAQLAAQDAITAALDTSGAVPVSPNLITLSLQRRLFDKEHKGDLNQEREALRSQLTGLLTAFVGSHGWHIGGAGELIVNILIRSVNKDCVAQASVAQTLYHLDLHDDRGNRTVGVRTVTAVIGRAHDRPPRAFIALTDTSKLLSRQHVILRYRDLALGVTLKGRNRTTLNGVPLIIAQETSLRDGDVIACEHCTVTVRMPRL